MVYLLLNGWIVLLLLFLVSSLTAGKYKFKNSQLSTRERERERERMSEKVRYNPAIKRERGSEAGREKKRESAIERGNHISTPEPSLFIRPFFQSVSPFFATVCPSVCRWRLYYLLIPLDGYQSSTSKQPNWASYTRTRLFITIAGQLVKSAITTHCMP